MVDVYKQLGSRIRDYRITAGWSQAKLAEKAGLSSEFVSRVERGHRALSVLSLNRVAVALGIELKALFEFTEFTPEDEAIARANRVVNLILTSDDELAVKIEKMVEMLVSTP
jgi:transcriptional regulator with XRE-family HTH domain